MSRYTRVAIVPRYLPSTTTARYTAKGVRETGTGPMGIERGPRTQMMAAARAIWAMFFTVRIFFLFVDTEFSMIFLPIVQSFVNPKSGL